MDAHVKSRLVSAQEARGLLEKYAEVLTPDGEYDRLARTVIALTADYNRQADEIMAAYHALRATPEQTVARRLSALCAEVVAERDRLLSIRDDLVTDLGRQHAKLREHRAAIVVKMNQDGATLAMEQLAQDAAAVEKERDRLRDILLSAVTAAKNATLPPGFIWGNDAMEQFNFGKERAAEAVAGAIEAADRAAKETK